MALMKKPLRKTRRFRKRNYKVKKAIPYQTHLFRRNAVISRITQTGAGAITLTDGAGSSFISSTSADSMTNTIQWGTSMLFKLSSVIDSGDFTNLYDKYKIVGVKLKIMYQANTASTGGNSVMPVITYNVDHDDAAIPSSLNTVSTKAAARSRILTADRPINIYIKPKPAVALYQGIFSGFGSGNSMYVNSSSPDVQHFGLKFWINNFYTPAGANNQITIQPTYYLACKESQ